MSRAWLLRLPVLAVAIYPDEARWTSGRGTRITASGRIPLPAGLVSGGVVTEPARAGELLRASGDLRGIARMRTVVALPAERAVLRTMLVPPLGSSQLAELMEREVRRELPMLAENAHVAWGRAGERDGQHEVFVAGVPRDVVESHVAALRAAGLHVIGADLRVIASARAVGPADGIIAHVEESDAEIGIFRDGVPAIVRHVALAATAGDPAWLAQLTEELVRTMKFYRDSHRDDDAFDALPISLVGSGAPMAVLSDEMSASTGHDLEMPALRAHVLPEEETVRFSANIGLALKELAA
jgi:Tfp pilus assembly PilM family ATPase